MAIPDSTGMKCSLKKKGGSAKLKFTLANFRFSTAPAPHSPTLPSSFQEIRFFLKPTVKEKEKDLLSQQAIFSCIGAFWCFIQICFAIK